MHRVDPHPRSTDTAKRSTTIPAISLITAGSSARNRTVPMKTPIVAPGTSALRVRTCTVRQVLSSTIQPLASASELPTVVTVAGG
jgi:hypothetical protein